MGITEMLFMSVGLGMDAFAVAVCKGLSMLKMKWKKAIVIALYFGFFQALMPIIGYLLGNKLNSVVTQVDNYIAFFLIVAVGINMLVEAFKKDSEDDITENIDFKTMIILAIATSIDALAVGITFAFLDVNVMETVFTIGIITFLLSLIGVKIGNLFGEKYKKHAQIAGGVILILIAIKILLEK